MRASWYYHRLKKMGFSELIKRFVEFLGVLSSRLKYRSPQKWPYSRFHFNNSSFNQYPFPHVPAQKLSSKYAIYNTEFDLTTSLDWYSSVENSDSWPFSHYSKINYRPGNSIGDIRINWELNRLQFLPALSSANEDLARFFLNDWMQKNPFTYGPAYCAAMEVALRWISIYRAVGMFKNPIDKHFSQTLSGMATASGEFIESRLSTHSSAGNHLIVEAVGLFWIGKALEGSRIGTHWQSMARSILKEQVPKQINPDGTNQEQSFWYLGFVLDALLHYFLLEELTSVPIEVRNRVEKMLEFVNDMIFDNGTFPDYGDRDDGFVFRPFGDYSESPFPGMLSVGAHFFNRPEWHKGTGQALVRLAYFIDDTVPYQQTKDTVPSLKLPDRIAKPSIKNFADGGMTSMKWGNGSLLFRHAPLGLGNTCGHGHADALSLLLSWKDVPILVDLGSGQYNADQNIRNFFRSTIAHNTVEIGGLNQATILGPFMWDQSYKAKLDEAGATPFLHAQASHDGYMKSLSVVHTRRIEWPSGNHIEILDSFSGVREMPIRGAFHLGVCHNNKRTKQNISFDFGLFEFTLSFPPELSFENFFGSLKPFMGWKSSIYGEWEPIHTIVYTGKIHDSSRYKIILEIEEK